MELPLPEPLSTLVYEGNAATVIGKRVGNYVVERTLAAGNMGSVFVARHPALGREAAVKFLGRDLDSSPEMTKRFLDEARVTANLRHPNIVDIFDFGELDGRLYYVMELLEGVDLAGLMRMKQRFTVSEVVEMLRQVCSGLAAAHAAGVVHRDLKPGNVFVAQGRPVRLKLMDFGVAKILSTTGEQTHYGQIIGTPRYMSPEQALGQVDRVSIQSDLYSLGVIAYEMLVGKCPFEHQSPVMLLVMHVHHEVCPLDELAPDTPAWLSSLIQSCLAKAPQDRPTSAQEILARINECHSHSDGSDLAACFALPATDSANQTSLPSATRIALPDSGSAATRADTASSSMISARFPTDDAAKSGIDQSPPPLVAQPPAAIPQDARESADALPASTSEPAVPEAAAPNPPRLIVVKQAPSNVESRSSAPAAPTGGDIPAPSASAQGLETSISDGLGATAEPQTALVTLTDADRTVLNRLLFRMQRRGDFPAFVQNVGEVSKRADFEGSFSAEQLGTAILKDYSLTAKLLRIVNSAYANRFGGRIYSIRHAIVILGFERVRSLALSTSLFKNQGNKQHSGRISESAINSLVSGEIARQVSGVAEIDDPEQATVCSMFRNLGKHLVLVYLPELYDQIVALMAQQGIGMNLASERVLGLSMHKLGVGIAERWRLPNKIIAAMSAVPERTGRITRDEDKLAALADFSNQLCEIIVAEQSEGVRASALRALLNRHKNLVKFEEREITELMDSTQRAFEQRYSSLLGVAARQCRFTRAVATMTGREVQPKEQLAQPANHASADSLSADSALPGPVKKLELPQNPTPTPARVAADSAVQRIEKTKARVTKLQLTRVQEAATEPERDETLNAGASSLEGMVARVLSDAQQPVSTEQLLTPILRALAEALNVPRLIALRATQSRRELVPVGGVGDDIEGISKELRIPLSSARNAIDPFSLCYHARRDFLIDDVFAPRVSSTLPQRYFEVIGSTCLGLLYCGSPTTQTLVLLIDLEPQHRLPAQEKLSQYGRVRVALSRVAPSAAL